MTLEEFINLSNPRRCITNVQYTAQSGVAYAVFRLKCGHFDALNTRTGERHYHKSLPKNVKLFNYKPMVTNKEKVLKAYKEGSKEIKRMLLTLFDGDFSATELELLRKEDEISALKEELANCNKEKA